MVNRTKRLSLAGALKILQLRFGTQVKHLQKNGDVFTADSILGYERTFTRLEILEIEDKIFCSVGC